MKINMATIFFKPIIQCSLLLTTLVSGAYSATNFAPSADKKVLNINVGIYAPFSNEQAFIGRNMLGAMEMASEKVPSDRIHYAFYTLDELPVNNADSIRSVQKFIEVHKINVLLTEGSQNGLLVAPLAKKNNLIHFSMASDPAIADGSNNFLAWSPEYEQAAVLVKKLQQKKVKELGVISTDEISDRVLSQSVIKQVGESSTIKISVQEEIKPGTKNFNHLMSKLKGKNPDLYLIMASPKDIEHIQAAMVQAHLNKPITTIVDRVTPEVMKVFNGQWYIDTHAMKPEFVNQYQEAYLNYPVTEAGYAFDVFNIFNQSALMATKNNKAFSSQAVAQQIKTLAVGTGVMGPFNMDNQGILYTKSEVKKIKDGQVITG